MDRPGGGTKEKTGRWGYEVWGGGEVVGEVSYRMLTYSLFSRHEFNQNTAGNNVY